ncbi:hypothetical protein KCP76_00985 [Salmonella enterica subsp. enterica serovar Weltevreden]|nr:hypothetical protein KCP76_00985 [Salmonella enterica subsp. enterica serovar Weltevreden]
MLIFHGRGGYAADQRASDGAGGHCALSGLGGRRIKQRGMNAQAAVARREIQKPTDRKTRCRRLWISTGMASAPPAATVL